MLLQANLVALMSPLKWFRQQKDTWPNWLAVLLFKMWKIAKLLGQAWHQVNHRNKMEEKSLMNTKRKSFLQSKHNFLVPSKNRAHSNFPTFSVKGHFKGCIVFMSPPIGRYSYTCKLTHQYHDIGYCLYFMHKSWSPCYMLSPTTVYYPAKEV